MVIKKNEVQAYFAHDSLDTAIKRDVQRFLGGIERFFPRAGKAGLRWRIVKDQDWHSAWRRFFTSQKIGQGFWVTPPWLMPPKSRSRQVITIEPGMAFGTGTHATTRGCTSFIETVTRSFQGTAFTALDVGTGSGILAIALAKLGAKKVWALDNDPVAVKVARENLKINDVESSVALSGKKLSEIRKIFPLVVANLTAETILDLAADLIRRVAPKGFLILSGIVNSKAADIIRRLAPDGFRVVRQRKEKEWTTLLLRRK